MRIRLLLATVLFVQVTSFAADAKLRDDIKADRVLFLGNSITRHGVLEKIGWTTEWGMAASAEEKDYVHLVASALGELRGKKPEIHIKNIADFERTLATYDINEMLKEAFAFKPDLVILAIGENVPGMKNDADKALLKGKVSELLAKLKENSKPVIIVRGCFWTDKAKDEALQQACASAGGTFVDISALGKDESNYARSERKFQHDGVAAHPGDKGMKAIADAIVAAMKK
ncbi:MAG TPA: SGNH/GDSL hydrolase family protein [Planctomycetota bacterium]|nr:SGNH/GDSL hydrolase family protein [Planctomycetota bacterium]